MESARERILEALEANPAGLCDGCLSEEARVHPHQATNQICRRLADRGVTHRAKRLCSRCASATKLVNQLGATPPSELQPVKKELTIAPQDLGGALDSIRRRIVEIVNRLDDAHARGEGLSRRIQRLRDSEALPGTVACMMLTLNSLRNLAVYEQTKLTAKVHSVIDSAWAVVEEWAAAQSSLR